MPGLVSSFRIYFFSAMSNYTTSPCPVGQYCPEATDNPIPCPNGTFRNSTGAGNISDCHLCPAGRYCPLSNRSSWGFKCPNGSFCRPGSAFPVDCLAGYYCEGAETQLPCPAGYYCPERSPSPIPCPEGHYCDPANRCYNDSYHQDAGACYPNICPLGEYQSWHLSLSELLKTMNHTRVYFVIFTGYRHKEVVKGIGKTFNETCEICRPGTYGNDPKRAICRRCRGGVICLEGVKMFLTCLFSLVYSNLGLPCHLTNTLETPRHWNMYNSASKLFSF